MTVQEANQIINATRRCLDPRVIRATEIVSRIIVEDGMSSLCHFGDFVLFGHTVDGWNAAGVLEIARVVFENALDADLDGMVSDLEGSAEILDYWRMVDGRVGELVSSGVPVGVAEGMAEREVTEWCS